MKLKKLKLLSISTALLLSGCSFTWPTVSGNESSNSSATSSHSLPSISYNDQGQGYVDVESFSFTADNYNAAAAAYNLPSIGNQKVLVIPVEFTDKNTSNLASGHSKAELHDVITKGFFGDSTNTAWESVASFYHKSSNGLLNLTGTVTPFYQAGISTKQFNNLVDSVTSDNPDYYDPTWTILEDAVEWYKQETGSSLAEFDQNNDGFLDAVFMVYAAPSDPDSDYFWAYQYYDYDNEFNHNVNSPAGFTYAWASYDFFFEGYGEDEIDSHTFIHEFGHVLGLDDYYSMDYDYGDYGALGGLDMMDYNIGDHNGYSKMRLDWTFPKYVTGNETETIITLAPFELVLLNDNWNGAAFDEYLLLEFYTPTGLNEKDAFGGGYPETSWGGTSTFSENGIKLYHVDSRVGSYSWSDNSLTTYVDTLFSHRFGEYLQVAMSNTESYSTEPDAKLISLIEPDGGNYLLRNKDNIADNSFLFQAGDIFDPADYDYANSVFKRGSNGVTFNDGTPINYQIEILSVSDSAATIKLIKL